MKKILVLSILISLAMICSCQKHDSAAEQQLDQRKVELDQREEALAERESALAEREKALDARERALTERKKNALTAPTGLQGQTPDAAQVNADTDPRIQQLPAEVRALIPSPPQMDAARAEKAEKDRERQAILAQSQPRLQELQTKTQSKMQVSGMSGGAVFPAPAATFPIPSPAVEAPSPSPSPTPE